MKTAIAILIFSYTLFSATLESQTPPPPPPPPPPVSGTGLISNGDNLLMDGKIMEALNEYRKTYSLKKTDCNYLHNLACAFSLAGETDSSFKYLYLSMKIKPDLSPLTDPDLLQLRDTEKWNDFENEVIAELNTENNNRIKDIEYAKTLFRLLCKDQYCFYETGIAVRQLGPVSPVVTALRRLQSMINKENLAELEAIITLKGWPKISQVGPEAAGAAFYVLQHSNGDAQQKYIELFRNACIEKEGNWNQYALMFDRMRMNQHQPQRYGTHFILDNRASGKKILYPLEDKTKVDEWRKEIGLEPLEDYIKRMNIDNIAKDKN
jgi:hypothetical protein